MKLASEGQWEFWEGGAHPSSIGCTSEGRDICTCKYHIVDAARTNMTGYDSYKEAAEKFKSLTGVSPLRAFPFLV